MAQNQLNMPVSFGGLMRYSDEYKSPFVLTPTQVIVFIIIVIALVSALKIFWPIGV